MYHMHMQLSVQSPGRPTIDLVDTKTEQHVCKCCGEKFIEIKSILAHMMHFDKTHVVCHVCRKSLASKFRLKRHLRQSSCDGKKFDCPDCKMQFSTKRTLRHHSRVHTGLLPPKSFVCAHCGSIFEREYCLKRHMAKHNDE